jgi:hypothetical protein
VIPRGAWSEGFIGCGEGVYARVGGCDMFWDSRKGR